MKKRKIEVLSPAGSWKALEAAAKAGADSVYFGVDKFNARRNAENFSEESIDEIVSFCHENSIKAYLALNTLVFGREISAALKIAEKACEGAVDAVLVQDIGLASLLKAAAPDLPLHASTQMTVHNSAGLELLSDLGFSRAVLSRELSKKEIAKMTASSKIETEIFVHGSLCMSMSGQCYLSSFLGGRSGNRGLCAQPCRLPFQTGNSRLNALSLKDLSLFEKMKELKETGIDCLKIEGRMKSPEYVAAATSICVSAVEGGKIEKEKMGNLARIYSREGFTSGYFDGVIDGRMFGIHKEIKGSAAKIPAERNSNVPRKIGVSFVFFMDRTVVRLEARDEDGNIAVCTMGPPEEAVSVETSESQIKRQLMKTGSTPFSVKNIETVTERGLCVPVSEINRLRRKSLGIIYKKRENSKKKAFNMPCDKLRGPVLSTVSGHSVKSSALRFRFRKFSQIPNNLDIGNAELIFLPLDEIIYNKGKAKELNGSGRLGAELPRAVFGAPEEKKLQKGLEEIRKLGIKDVLCGNLGTLETAFLGDFSVHADFGLNTVNGYSIESLSKFGIKSCVMSFETNIAEIFDAAAMVPGIPAGMIVYGRVPLMLLRNCPEKSLCGCKNGEDCGVKDRRGIFFPLICSGGTAELLNSRPIWLADKRGQLENHKVSFFEFYFTVESRKEAGEAIAGWESGTVIPEFTRGGYFRKTG